MWDPQEYGGLKKVSMDPKRIWTPDIILTDMYVCILYKLIAFLNMSMDLLNSFMSVYKFPNPV